MFHDKDAQSNRQETYISPQKGRLTVVRVTGSHHYLHKPGSRLVTVPVHAGETLSPVLVKSILEQAGLTVEELIELL